MLTIPDLKDKAVLITGASTGIGAALAKAFAAQGAKVGLHYNSSKEAAESVADDIRKAGGTVETLKADISDPKATAAMVESFAKTFGTIDGLINNAGGMVKRVSYEAASVSDYDEIMDLNAKSIIVASGAAIPHLKKQGGFIINTTSVAARNGASGGAGLYGSSKAYVANVTRGMAKELIPFGIRVNAVAPGIISTPFHERYSTEAQLAAALATIPQGRFATAEEVTGTYLFLASNLLSPYIIGQVIEVNGGQLMP